MGIIAINTKWQNQSNMTASCCQCNWPSNLLLFHDRSGSFSGKFPGQEPLPCLQDSILRGLFGILDWLFFSPPTFLSCLCSLARGCRSVIVFFLSPLGFLSRGLTVRHWIVPVQVFIWRPGWQHDRTGFSDRRRWLGLAWRFFPFSWGGAGVFGILTFVFRLFPCAAPCAPWPFSWPWPFPDPVSWWRSFALSVSGPWAVSVFVGPSVSRWPGTRPPVLMLAFPLPWPWPPPCSSIWPRPFLVRFWLQMPGSVHISIFSVFFLLWCVPAVSVTSGFRLPEKEDSFTDSHIHDRIYSTIVCTAQMGCQSHETKTHLLGIHERMRLFHHSE